MGEIRSNMEYERHLKAGWIDCFRPANKTLYRTLLGMSLQSLQQLTGVNYFFYYSDTIFATVGIEDSFIAEIILGAVNFVCTFGGLYVMQRVRYSLFCSVLPFINTLAQFGRRIPLIVGGIWQSIWMFIFAAAGTAKVPEDNPGIAKCKASREVAFVPL